MNNMKNTLKFTGGTSSFMVWSNKVVTYNEVYNFTVKLSPKRYYELQLLLNIMLYDDIIGKKDRIYDEGVFKTMDISIAQSKLWVVEILDMLFTRKSLPSPEVLTRFIDMSKSYYSDYNEDILPEYVAVKIGLKEDNQIDTDENVPIPVGVQYVFMVLIMLSAIFATIAVYINQ